MPVSPARKIAYQVLRSMETRNAMVVEQLQSPEVSKLKDADRRLATEIVMGVLRWQGELDHQIARHAKRKLTDIDSEVVTLLRIGIYQIQFLDRVPKHAAVDESVELAKHAKKRSASGFVNAVLRKCDAPREKWDGRDFESLSEEMREGIRRAFPAWLLKKWEGHECNETPLRVAYASLDSPPTTLRLVDSSADREAVFRELEAEGIKLEPCVYAQKRGAKVLAGQVLTTRAYREGRVVIQDEASQLVAELVAPEPGQQVLDLCAAPGMKAGQIAQTLGSGTMVVCDRSAARLRTLGKLLPRTVPASVQLATVRLDAAEPLPFTQSFDRILLDAPCTGTGTLARNPDIKWRISLDDVTRLGVLQAAMLRNALPLLAYGGLLVYATCSLEREENALVVEQVLVEQPSFRMLSADELKRKFPHLEPFIDSQGYFRTRPDRHAMDGFNAAVLVRQAK